MSTHCDYKITQIYDNKTVAWIAYAGHYEEQEIDGGTVIIYVRDSVITGDCNPVPESDDEKKIIKMLNKKLKDISKDLNLEVIDEQKE